MRTRLPLALVLVVLAACSAPVSALADPGDLDQSFTDIVFGEPDTVGGIVPGPGGEFVISSAESGAFQASKFKSDGESVDGFGDEGTGAIPLFDRYSADSRAAVALSNGKVVVGGSALVSVPGATPQRRAVLVRFTSRGNADPTFGDKGIVALSFGAPDAGVTGLAPAPGGKLLVSGYEDAAAGLSDATTYTPSSRMVVARVTASGRLDQSFGTQGFTTAAPAGASAATSGILRLRSGRILVGGSSQAGAHTRVTVARFGSGGGLDRSFGSSGFAIVNAAGGKLRDSGVEAMAITPTGRIVLAGYAEDDAGDIGLVLGRLTSAGRLDTAFGHGGIVHDGNAFSGLPAGLALQRDGKLVVAGDRFFGLLAVRRYTALGARDLDFGAGGVAADTGSDDSGDSAADDTTASGVLIQADGRIVVPGIDTSEEDRGDFSDTSGIAVRFEGGTLLVQIGKGPVRAAQLSVPVRVRCLREARGRCSGTLRLRTAYEVALKRKGAQDIRALGAARISLRPGRSQTIRVPLNAVGRKLTSARHDLTARAIADIHDAHGARGTTRRVLIVRTSR
jgi:uncharacterized delta-60 repeat protein